MKDLASLHLDNHDSRLKYYHLFMTMPAETEIPHYDLPAGYSFTTYAPGDRDTWIEIEKSAKEFSTFEEGVDAWQRYYGKHEDVLPDRMFFIVDPNGKKVATATAFFDEKLPAAGCTGFPCGVMRKARGFPDRSSPIRCTACRHSATKSCSCPPRRPHGSPQNCILISASVPCRRIWKKITSAGAC